MKTSILFLLGAALSACTMTAAAKSLEIKVEKIRSDKGSILLMVKTDDRAEPIFRMSEARREGVGFRIDSLASQTVEVSLLHDENANYQMDKDENGMPLEGFGGKKCNLTEEASSVRISMTYLNAE